MAFGGDTEFLVTVVVVKRQGFDTPSVPTDRTTPAFVGNRFSLQVLATFIDEELDLTARATKPLLFPRQNLSAPRPDAQFLHSRLLYH
jgi:hypothetical protein